MKIGFIAPLVLPALGRFALASENDSNSGKSLRGSDGGGLFGGAAGEVSTEGEDGRNYTDVEELDGGGLFDGVAGEVLAEGEDGRNYTDVGVEELDGVAGEVLAEGEDGRNYTDVGVEGLDGVAGEDLMEGEDGRNFTDVEGLDGEGLVEGVTGEISTEGEGEKLVDVDGIDGKEEESEEESEEVVEIVVGVAVDGYYDGSIYEVYNGLPADDHPVDNVVVEVMDYNEANPTAFQNIPPPPNQGLGPGAKPVFEKGPDGKIRVMIQYKEGKKATVMKGLKGVVLHLDWEEWNTFVVSVPERALKGLQENPDIEKLEPDVQVKKIVPPVHVESDIQGEIELFGDDTEPSAGSGNGSFRRRRLAQYTPYGVDMMEVSKLRMRGYGQKVCVLDTGYDRNHPDLPKDVDWVGISGTPPADTGSHGTHVAGTIAAVDDGGGVVGVAPDASLVIGPYLSDEGYISTTLEGVRMCRDMGAKIVNMSYGYGREDCMRFGNSFNSIYNDRLNGFYYNDNMLLVAAAGNHGDCPIYSDELLYPASYDAVMSVAAVDSYARRANFSAKNSYVNIAAPGVGVWSTVPGGGYGLKSGTSMAAPHVAAMAAVVWSAMPWLTAAELRHYLESSAENIYLDYTGSGLVTHGFFPIVSQRLGQCLDHPGGGFIHFVQLRECHGDHEQLWTYDKARKLIVMAVGWCLDASPNEGGYVAASGCDPNSGNQQWDYDVDAKTFKLQGYCLSAEAPDGSSGTFLGGNVSMRSCNGQKNQKWHLGNRYTEKALLCGDNNCFSGGNVYRASVGNWDHMPHQIGNDQLTRVIIPPGYAVELFEHGNYGGWNYIFASQDDSNYVSLNLGALDNSVSSFKVHRLPDTGKVKLCRNIDCTGGVYYASVGQWSSMPYEIGNDQLSFVSIPQGYTFEYFEHGNWGGGSRKFGSCDKGINLRFSSKIVSSFKVGLAC